jgi:hypothetical protein
MRRTSAASQPPGAGPPGLPPTDSANLLAGVYAKVDITNAGTLHCFDWEIRFRQALADVSGHGDEWEQWKPVRQGWTMRARGYMTRSAPDTTTYWGDDALKQLSPGDECTVACYSDYGTTVIFTGTAYAEDISMSAGYEAMVEQEITVRGNAAPSAGFSDTPP